MKRRGMKIEDILTEAQERTLEILKCEGFKLYSILTDDLVAEVNRARTGGYQYAWIYPDGRVEK